MDFCRAAGQSEVIKLLPEMLRAAEILAQKIQNLQFILPLADTLEEKTVGDIISGFTIKVKVISGQTYDADFLLLIWPLLPLERQRWKLRCWEFP